MVALIQGSWRPALLVAWRRPTYEGWACRLRYLYRFDRVGEAWFLYDARFILRVVVDHDPMTWWRPSVDEPADY